jgi:hypothetical protein
MAWRNVLISPGLEYSITGQPCFSKACLIFMTSSRRKKKQPLGKFCSGPSTYRIAPRRRDSDDCVNRQPQRASRLPPRHVQGKLRVAGGNPAVQRLAPDPAFSPSPARSYSHKQGFKATLVDRIIFPPPVRAIRSASPAVSQGKFSRTAVEK